MTDWTAEVETNGGPVLLANASDFEHWHGSDPLPESERRELHLWGGFVGELPSRFRNPGPGVGIHCVPVAPYGASR